MTARARSTESPLNRWLRRLDHNRRTLFAPGDGLALLVAAGLLLMPILALTQADWPADLRTLIPAMLLGLVFGFLLARSHYNELFALILSVVYGTAFVGLIAAINEPGNLMDGVGSVLIRSARWLVDAFTGGINQDEMVFTLLVSALFWFLAYNTAWHLFRVDRVWRVILPPGLILVVNTIYYTGQANLDPYLLAFVFLSLLLIVRSTLDARAWDWYVNGIRMPKGLRGQFFRVGAVLAAVALLIGIIPPANDLQDRLNRFQEFMQSDPLSQLTELYNRLFASVDTQGPTTADYYGGDSLQLGGSIRLGEQVVFWVDAPQGRHYYWRSRVFDVYSNGRWSPGADVRLTVEQAPFIVKTDPNDMNARQPVQQRFTIGLNASRLIYAAPQPLQVDLPARADLQYTADHEVMNISVIRPVKVLNRGESYTVTSLLTDATAAQLRAVPATYSDWVTQLYLQVPPSITDRTRLLAQQIVDAASATTPYDRAKAIETWLRANILYSETIPQPPLDRDPVEWVLFDLKQGYCNYYASAMVMMLRSLGIPARAAAGFAQGNYDDAQQAFTVLERDAHTWVEVYFPGYGWIEFEPTSAQAPLVRSDDAPLPPVPSATPAFTATPTPTRTPTPSPTPDLTTPLPQVAPQLPSLTPTPSPSPTATPVIVPTQPPPLTPRTPPGLLDLVLRALGVALLVLLVIAILVAIGFYLYWWWEWRGLRHLTPITRAYARLERYLDLIGVHLTPQQTTEERRRQIVNVLPKAEPPVSTITRMYTAERYGPGISSPEQAAVQADVAGEAWSETRWVIVRRWLRRFAFWRRGQ